MAKKDEVRLGHVCGSGETVTFVFSADKYNCIKMTMILEDKRQNRHFEVEHEPMDCLVDELIKWLQEKRK